MRIALLDTETTGVDADAQIIEIGVLLVDTESPDVVSYTEMQDPGYPLSEETFELTGLRDADVQGHQIDWPHVQAIVNQADLCVAFNAAFDRRFLDPRITAKQWACAHKMVDWTGYHRMRHGSLEYLALRHGLPVQSHRALDDCRTTWALLQMQDPCERRAGRTYFEEMLESMRIGFGIAMLTAPRKKNEVLKKLGFRWHQDTLTWWRHVRVDQVLDLSVRLDDEKLTNRQCKRVDITDPAAVEALLLARKSQQAAA